MVFIWSCAQIAAALKGSKAIEALDMGGNNIAADGIEVTFCCIRHCLICAISQFESFRHLACFKCEGPHSHASSTRRPTLL